jgi:hypothetical protein
LLILSSFLASTGLKYLISTRYYLPSFCDTNSDWANFDTLMKTNSNYTRIQEPYLSLHGVMKDCEPLCNNNGYYYAKMFQLDYLFTYSITNFFASRLFKWKLSSQIYMAFSALLSSVLSFTFFYYNKILSLGLSNIFLCFLIAPYGYFYERKSLLSLVILSFLFTYMTGLKFFFELYFYSIYNKYTSLITILFPYIIKFLQSIFWTIMTLDSLEHKYYTRGKLSLLMNLIFFEFMGLAALHVTVVLKEGLDYSIWINLCISFFMDLDEKIGIVDWMLTKIKIVFYKFICKKEYKQKQPSDYEILFTDLRIELQFMSVIVYAIVIYFRYYNYAETSITDCMGMPFQIKDQVYEKLYILIGVMLGFLILQLILRFVLMKIFKIEDNSYVYKFDTITEKIAFITAGFGGLINFGIPGLYSFLTLDL